MNNSYVAPTYRADGFHCPVCRIYAHQMWYRVYIDPKSREPYLPDYPPKKSNEPVYLTIPCVGAAHGSSSDGKREYKQIDDIAISECQRCNARAIWVEGKLVDPLQSTAPYPNEDMPEDVKKDFMEARDIVERSPRAAAALLRLATERLLNRLVEHPKKGIDDNIKFLVAERSLDTMIQEALDVLRVSGNNAVHPLGRIDVDDKETALRLFTWLNTIVVTQITLRQQINNDFNNLPEQVLESIRKRDKRDV